MPNEKLLWNWMRRAAPKDAWLSRFEPGRPAGMPDVHVCWRGRAAWVELKDDQEKVRPAQAVFLRGYWAAGGTAVVLASAPEGVYLLPGRAVTLERRLVYTDALASYSGYPDWDQFWGDLFRREEVGNP